MKSYGQLPYQFFNGMSSKYDSLKKESRKNYKTTDKNEFISTSSYLINQFILSGRLIFNDTSTLLINKVASNLLIPHPELKKGLEFFVVKSSSVNAFATLDGKIFVTTSLLARIENEAQLAFVLAHEISHYIKQHSISQYDYNSALFSEKAKDQSDIDNIIHSMSSYSKSLEFQADDYGIFLLKDSEYDALESIKALTLLKYAKQPFGQIQFNPNYFFAEFIISPIWNYNLKIEDSVLIQEDDTKSTHPSLTERISVVQNLLKGYSNENKKLYFNSNELIEATRKNTKNEELLLLLSNREFIKIIYECIYLDPKGEKPAYQNMLCKALFGIAKEKLKSNYSDPSSEECYGELEQVNYFFKNLSSRQALILAFSYLLKHENNDSFISELAVNLYNDIRVKHKLEFYKLVDYGKAGRKKINALLKKYKFDTSSSFSYSNLLDSLSKYNDTINNEEFVCVDFDPNLSTKYFDYNTKNSNWQKPKSVEERGLYNNHNLYFGLDSILIVDPSFINFDKRENVKVKSSEKSIHQLNSELEYLSDKNNIYSKIISPTNFEINDIESYNEMCLLKAWYYDKLNYPDAISMNFDFITNLKEKYRIKHILFIHVLALTIPKPKEAVKSALVYSILVYPLLYTIPYLTQTNTHLFILANLLSIENDNFELITYKEIKNKNNRFVISNNLYETFYQIKKDPK